MMCHVHEMQTVFCVLVAVCRPAWLRSGAGMGGNPPATAKPLFLPGRCHAVHIYVLLLQQLCCCPGSVLSWAVQWDLYRITLDNVLCRHHTAYTTVFMSSVWLCLRAAGCLMHA